jgi:hypothetical protein
MALCSLCAGGVHNHDRYGPNAPEVQAGRVPLGSMAECPSVVAKGGPGCSCTYREPGGKQQHCPTCRCGGDR